MSDTRPTPSDSKDFSRELEALKAVLNALSPLGDEAKRFVFRTASERLNIDVPVPDGKQTSLLNDRGFASTGGSLEGVDPKQFLRHKKPQTEMQRMACLAFYLTHARKTEHFKTADLTALNTEAAGGKFSNPSVTVMNGTNQSRFFAPAGNAGLKQITGLCEDYVNALPDQEAAKAAIQAHRPARRKAGKKKVRKGN